MVLAGGSQSTFPSSPLDLLAPSLEAAAPLSLKHGFSVFLAAWEDPKE